MNKILSGFNEIKELLCEIDEKTLENVSMPRRELVQLLKEIYFGEKGGNGHA